MTFDEREIATKLASEYFDQAKEINEKSISASDYVEQLIYLRTSDALYAKGEAIFQLLRILS